MKIIDTIDSYRSKLKRARYKSQRREILAHLNARVETLHETSNITAEELKIASEFIAEQRAANQSARVGKPFPRRGTAPKQPAKVKTDEPKAKPFWKI